MLQELGSLRAALREVDLENRRALKLGKFAAKHGTPVSGASDASLYVVPGLSGSVEALVSRRCTCVQFVRCLIVIFHLVLTSRGEASVEPGHREIAGCSARRAVSTSRIAAAFASESSARGV
jgi:hypothetical protein